MFRVSQAWMAPAAASLRWAAGLALGSALLLGACSGNFSPGDLFSELDPRAAGRSKIRARSGPARSRSASSCRSRRPATPAWPRSPCATPPKLALAEFNTPDLQLLVKDDGGSAPGAQQAAQQALDEGAEIILGPLVRAVGRARSASLRARATCR